MPLTSTLYDLLKGRFGSVLISNDGEAMTSSYGYNASSGKPTLQINGWGEGYNVDCPFCRDSRQRLSINHRYGVYDPVTESENLTLARCFNDDCLKDPGRYMELKEKIFGFMNRDQRRRLMTIKPGVRRVVRAASLQEVAAPGVVVGLSDLPHEHPAIKYLHQREFDPTELSDLWNVRYCTKAFSDYSLAQDRLIIPVVMNNVRVGWQARYVGDPEQRTKRIPKYYTMPSFPKSLVLYNHDGARQPVVVVCEGPTDVWRLGPEGVALMGKQASLGQQTLLANRGQNQPIVVLLDGDARGDADRLFRQLRPFAKCRLAQITLPEGRDPGSYERSALWSIIQTQMSEQGVDLRTMNEAALTNEQ